MWWIERNGQHPEPSTPLKAYVNKTLRQMVDKNSLVQEFPKAERLPEFTETLISIPSFDDFRKRLLQLIDKTAEEKDEIIKGTTQVGVTIGGGVQKYDVIVNSKPESIRIELKRLN